MLKMLELFDSMRKIRDESGDPDMMRREKSI